MILAARDTLRLKAGRTRIFPSRVTPESPSSLHEKINRREIGHHRIKVEVERLLYNLCGD